MVRDARGVLLFEFDGLLFDLSAKFARILTFPTKGDIFHATVEIFHDKRHHNLLAGLNSKGLTVLRNHSPLLRLKIIRLPDKGWRRCIRTGNRNLGDRLRTARQGEAKGEHESLKSSSHQYRMRCLTLYHHTLLFLFNDLLG